MALTVSQRATLIAEITRLETRKATLDGSIRLAGQENWDSLNLDGKAMPRPSLDDMRAELNTVVRDMNRLKKLVAGTHFGTGPVTHVNPSK